MSEWMMRLLVVLIVVLAGSLPAFAQRPGSLYVFGGGGVAHQEGPTGEVPVTYVTAPGGTTPSWMVGGGVFVASVMSIEGELSSTGWMESTQPSRYGMTFNEERRDRFGSLLARFGFPRGGRFRIEPVAGLIVTRPEAWSQVDYFDFSSPAILLQRGPRLQHQLDTTVGITFGCDVRVGGRHVALLPYFRMSDTEVSEGRYDASSEPREISAIYPGGYPKWTIRTGAALRVDF
jgi:hypothetical protein